jgi:hypothetical protein
VNSTCVGYLNITVVNSNTPCSGSASSATCNHVLATARATDNHRAVVAVVASFANSTPTTSVSYNGAAMTLVPNSSVFSNNAFAAIYFIKDAALPANAATYGVSVTSSGAMGIVADVIELRGVDQVQTYDGNAVTRMQTQNCGVAQPSDSITMSAGQQNGFVVDVASFNGGSGTGTASGVKILEASSGSAHGIASYVLPANATVLMTWGGKNCNNHVHAVAAFRRGTT